MLKEMKELIQELLYYSDAYYNKNESLISDYEYDRKFDRLQYLERETGIVLANSPSIHVGAEVVSKLNKVDHDHPMLSLDKTKNIEDVKNFLKDRCSLAMLKMDGLTVTLTYRNGELVAAETRGNGTTGEDILHNAKRFNNIPVKIQCKDEFVVDGEAIIDLETFREINESMIEKAKEEGATKGLSGIELDDYISENSYKNARNLAAGSVRQLNSEITAKRKVRFIAWKNIKGIESDSFCERLDILSSYGFEVVPYIQTNRMNAETAIDYLKKIATERKYPIDGIVFSYDSVSYGDSLGATTHHLRSQYAYKFYDEEQETIIRDIEWSLGRTGVLTPVAIFDPIEIEGTTVERASLHNVSIFKDLELGLSDTVLVYKANMIIPQISDNLTRSNTFELPIKCPVCGGETKIVCDNGTEILICNNPDCEGKQLNKISNFVSRQGMDINGLSKKTIEKLISKNILRDYTDIYKIKDKKALLMTIDGFGKKKIDNLLEEIEKSKTVTLDRFLCALGIPGVGAAKCKRISKIFDGNFERFSEAIQNKYNFSKIEDFGPVINKKIYDYWEQNELMILELADTLVWENEKKTEQRLEGMTFVITGKLFEISRADLKSQIEKLGGKVSNNISSNTKLLINNDLESKSSKNTEAKRLGIPIVSEKEFLKKFLYKR